MTTLERANLLVHRLRTRGVDSLETRAGDIIAVLGDLIHDLANAEQRRISLEYQLDELRASVVAALSSAGPEVAEDERTS